MILIKIQKKNSLKLTKYTDSTNEFYKTKLVQDAKKEKLFEQCKELEEKMTITQESLANITRMHQQSHMLAIKSQNDLEVGIYNLR